MSDVAEVPKPIAAAGEPYPPPTAAWGMTGILFIFYLISVLDRNIFSLLLQPIKEDLHLNDFELSLLTGAAFAVFYAATGLPLGWAMDRFARRPLIWAGVTVWSLATAACGLANNFLSFFTARAFVGSAEAVMIPANHSIIPDMFPKKRLGLAFSIYSIGGKVGGGTALVVGGFLAAMIDPRATYELALLGDFRGWQLIFMAAGLPGLLAAFLIFVVPEPKRRQDKLQAESASYKDYLRFVIKNPRFMIAIHLGDLLVLAAGIGILAWTPAFFVRVHGMSESEVGTWLGFGVALSSVLSIPLHGLIVDWFYARGRRDISLIYLACVAFLVLPVLTIGYLSPSPLVALVMLCIAQALFGAYSPLTNNALQLMVPQQFRGKAAAVNLVVTTSPAMIVGHSAIGAITEFVYEDPQKLGWSMVTYSAFALPIAACLLLYAAKPLRERLAAEDG